MIEIHDLEEMIKNLSSYEDSDSHRRPLMQIMHSLLKVSHHCSFKSWYIRGYTSTRLARQTLRLKVSFKTLWSRLGHFVSLLFYCYSITASICIVNTIKYLKGIWGTFYSNSQFDIYPIVDFKYLVFYHPPFQSCQTSYCKL